MKRRFYIAYHEAYCKRRRFLRSTEYKKRLFNHKVFYCEESEVIGKFLKLNIQVEEYLYFGDHKWEVIEYDEKFAMHDKTYSFYDLTKILPANDFSNYCMDRYFNYEVDFDHFSTRMLKEFKGTYDPNDNEDE